LKSWPEEIQHQQGAYYLRDKAAKSESNATELLSTWLVAAPIQSLQELLTLKVCCSSEQLEAILDKTLEDSAVLLRHLNAIRSAFQEFTRELTAIEDLAHEGTVAQDPEGGEPNLPTGPLAYTQAVAPASEDDEEHDDEDYTDDDD
jgi:hypothetical protein